MTDRDAILAAADFLARCHPRSREVTVYVDDMRVRAKIGRFTANWSHMFADTPAELAAFAAALGLSPRWLQHPGKHREHYDVTDTVRKAAMGAGAVSLTYPAGTGALMEKRRAQCQCKTFPSCEWGRAVTQGAPT